MSNAMILADNLLTYRGTLAVFIEQALSQTTFSNRGLIAPRRLKQIGTEEVEAFLTFLENQDQQAVIQHGYQLAGEGLGRETVFAMGTAVRRACRETIETGEVPALFDLTEQYTTAFLEGYLNCLEEEIRQEQERTRQAYMRSLES